MAIHSGAIRTRSQLRTYIATLAVATRSPHTHHCSKCAALPEPIDYERDLCGQCLDQVYEDWAEDAKVSPEDEEIAP